MLFWMNTLAVVLAWVLTATQPTVIDRDAEDRAPSYGALPCGLEALAARLEHEQGWRDIRAAALANAALNAELTRLMPAFDLAFVHAPTQGVLLVQGRLLDGAVPGHVAADPGFWDEMISETRKACGRTGVVCEVERLPDAPFGIAARTHLEEGGMSLQRITLAFVADNACSYAMQFSGPAQRLSEGDWQEMSHRLAGLRKLVVRP